MVAILFQACVWYTRQKMARGYRIGAWLFARVSGRRACEQCEVLTPAPGCTGPARAIPEDIRGLGVYELFENVTNEELSAAIDELISTLGVKEEMPSGELVKLLQKGDVQACVQAIAARLGLPIRVCLSYISEEYRPGDGKGFRSTHLSRTDSAGRGIDSIIAQVTIPQDLPLFGSASLREYPVHVGVSENCSGHPDSFIAVIAHELSHVLLRSLFHPKQDSELHTDLVPVLLGFRESVRKGRTTSHVRSNGKIRTTTTTTYGYLTSSQFEFACRKVTDILKLHQGEKEHLLDLITGVRDKLDRAVNHLARFRDYLTYLDSRLPKDMTGEDARSVVSFTSGTTRAAGKGG